MKTVKEVSDLTGVSVRTLHYYDEIGLLKPSEVTEAGYRLYDNESLKLLQQILFFKELDIPLKEVKEIMESPQFDKMQSLQNQKKLLILKRDRLNDLIDLIDKTLRGENDMSFKEFDMSEYFIVLEEFKHQNKDKVIEMWGSIKKFDEFIETAKKKEAKIAKGAIKEVDNKFGIGTSKYMGSALLNYLGDKKPKAEILFDKLTKDLSKAPCSKEIQQVVKEIDEENKRNAKELNVQNGDNYIGCMSELYLTNNAVIKSIDKEYGNGTAKFIGEAFKYYSEDYKKDF